MKLQYERLYVGIKFSWINTLEAQYTVVKIDLRKAYLLACQFYYTYESCIFMGEVRAKLDRYLEQAKESDH